MSFPFFQFKCEILQPYNIAIGHSQTPVTINPITSFGPSNATRQLHSNNNPIIRVFLAFVTKYVRITGWIKWLVLLFQCRQSMLFMVHTTYLHELYYLTILVSAILLVLVGRHITNIDEATYCPI